MFQFKVYDEYKKFNMFNDEEKCGMIATHNGKVVHFDITILISGDYYNFFYISEADSLSISYHRKNAVTFHEWRNSHPLKDVDPAIREKLKFLLTKLDVDVEPFAICKKMIEDYFDYFEE